MPSRPLDTEELLAQIGWVRALALRLARDPHVADDLTQDALLLALSDAARGPRSLRGWLGAVVANLARGARQGERRRVWREAAAARPEACPSTLELVERAATLRRLVGALLRLDEPYRTTLLLRFLEERSPREVAERMGCPVSTVSTRTAEGLARLRAQLGRGRDGPRAWLPSLLPLLPRPRGSALQATLTGAAVMSAKTKLILGVAAVAGAFLASRAWLQAPAAPAHERVAPDAGTALAAPPQAAAPRAATPEAARDELATPAPVAAVAAAEPAAWLVRGLVIDLSGRPVAGVDVCTPAARALPADAHHAGIPKRERRCATSDAEGRFVIEGEVPLELAVESAVYATVYGGFVFQREEEQEAVVVVARRILIAGLVTDELGRPVEGARLELHGPRVGAELGRALRTSRRVIPEARSDASGAFRITDAAELDQAELRATAPAFLPATVSVPPGGGESLRIVLRRSAPGARALVGHVRRPDGSPAAGARVSVGHCTAATDAEGVFALELEHEWTTMDPAAPVELVAAARGFLPAQRGLPSLAEAEEHGWPADIVLTLGGPPLSIRGRVVDEEDRPLRGIAVEVIDATEFGLVPVPGASWFQRATLEEISGGGDVRIEVHTDGDGAFELRGLLEREYTLEALEQPSLLTARTPPIAAGRADARIVLDRRTLGSLRGRVVDRAGNPVAGVLIAVSSKRRGSLAIGERATSDAEGRFALEGVTSEPAFLRLEGARIVPDIFRELPAGADRSALELEVALRCSLQIDWGTWQGRADELRIVAADERPLELVDLSGGGIGLHPSLTVGTGLSPVYAIPDSATQAVLLLRGQEVTRVPLLAIPAQLELLRL